MLAHHTIGEWSSRRGGPDSSHQVVYNFVGRRWGREILHTCSRRRKEEEEEEGKEEKRSSSRRGRGRRRKRKEGRKEGIRGRRRKKRQAEHALECKLGME